MLATADFDHNEFTQPDREADKALLVRFYSKSVQDKTASDREGRPVFREKDYIEIRFPGNRTDAVARPARDADIERFPAHYEAYKKRREMPEDGTPLSEWPQVSRTQVDELAFFNIKTVEALAAVNDSQGQNFRGFYTLRDKARKFLDAAKKGVALAELQSELESRDAEIQALQQQVDDLKALMESAPQRKTVDVPEQVAPPKKRGK